MRFWTESWKKRHRGKIWKNFNVFHWLKVSITSILICWFGWLYYGYIGVCQVSIPCFGDLYTTVFRGEWGIMTATCSQRAQEKNNNNRLSEKERRKREGERKGDKSDKVLAEESKWKGYRNSLYCRYNFSENIKLLQNKLLKHLTYFNYSFLYIWFIWQAAVAGYIVFPKNSYVEVLTLSTSECGLIWK